MLKGGPSNFWTLCNHFKHGYSDENDPYNGFSLIKPTSWLLQMPWQRPWQSIFNTLANRARSNDPWNEKQIWCTSFIFGSRLWYLFLKLFSNDKRETRAKADDDRYITLSWENNSLGLKLQTLNHNSLRSSINNWRQQSVIHLENGRFLSWHNLHS